MNNLKGCKVLVTPTSYGKTDPQLRIYLEQQVGEVVYNPTNRPLSSTEVAELLPGCDGFIAGLDSIDRQALQAADRLKVISRYGVGVDKVDLQAALEKGIMVTNTPGANSVSVAELTIGLMLALARRIPEACTAMRTGEWPRVFGMTLEGKCIGLLGLGSIGKQVALRLEAFGCRLAAYDPYPDLEFARQHGVKLLDLPELLLQADFISLHLPLNEATRGLVNKDFLSRIKRGAFLVNTARGELVDELAVAQAISSGQLGGAALDVFSQEPPGKDNPLLGLPQVIITPHTASHTDGAMQRMGWMALEDCLSVLRGEQPRYAVELTSGVNHG